MKNSICTTWLFGLFLFFLTSGICSQNIPNGGFEEMATDTVLTELSYPDNWHPYYWAGIECYPPPYYGIMTNNSHTGEYAIKMETTACEEPVNGWVHRPGGYVTGNPGTWSPETWSLEYNARPDYLEFFYKFHQESSDTALVEVMLFNYDSTITDVLQRVDTIGYAFTRLIEPADTYTAYELPIEYMSDSIPSFIHIEFGTGNDCTLSSCTPGTTLWVDDVSVSGGTVGDGNMQTLNQVISIYPNPSSDWFRIASGSNTPIEAVSITDYMGRKLMEWKGFQEKFNVSAFPSGTFFISIQTTEGACVKKFIKTN